LGLSPFSNDVKKVLMRFGILWLFFRIAWKWRGWYLYGRWSNLGYSCL